MMRRRARMPSLLTIWWKKKLYCFFLCIYSYFPIHHHFQVIPAEKDSKEYEMSRQAYASLLWSKQFYHYIVKNWLKGDEKNPAPPEKRLTGRNSDWKHLFNRDIVSMPDKWEYPWVSLYTDDQFQTSDLRRTEFFGTFQMAWISCCKVGHHE